MLIIICGPSGVGKSTLINMLVNHKNYHVMQTYTTRPERGDDHHKTSISLSKFNKHSEVGDWYWIKNPIFGNFYAEKYFDMIHATCFNNGHIWLLDMGLGYVDLYRTAPAKVIVLLPRNKEFLRANLTQVGRQDRCDQAVKEWLEWQIYLERNECYSNVITCDVGKHEVFERALAIIEGYKNGSTV